MSLRIVAGRWGGRRLEAPKGRTTRPTSDRVREALFSILGERVVGARVLDLCCGSGALGFEAMSRGAGSCTFVDRDRRAAEAVRANAAALGGADGAECFRVIVQPAAKFLRSAEPVDLVLCDPPYADVGPIAAALLSAATSADLVPPGGTVVVEHRAGEPPRIPDGFGAPDTRTYGDSGLLILRRSSLDSEP